MVVSGDSFFILTYKRMTVNYKYLFYTLLLLTECKCPISFIFTFVKTNHVTWHYRLGCLGSHHYQDRLNWFGVSWILPGPINSDTRWKKIKIKAKRKQTWIYAKKIETFSFKKICHFPNFLLTFFLGGGGLWKKKNVLMWTPGYKKM